MTLRGPQANHWKGGKSISTQGYILVSNHYDHPRATNGIMLEHIFVYEEFKKCCLLSWANVHHINHNKQDNRPENLDAMMIGQHTRIHASTIPNDRYCDNCHSSTTQADRNGGVSWFVNRKTGIGFWCQKCYLKLYWRPMNPHYKKQYLARIRRNG